MRLYIAFTFSLYVYSIRLLKKSNIISIVNYGTLIENTDKAYLLNKKTNLPLTLQFYGKTIRINHATIQLVISISTDRIQKQTSKKD